jgi:hypothetical protein
MLFTINPPQGGVTFSFIMEENKLRLRLGKCILACCVNLVPVAEIFEEQGNQSTRTIMKSLSTHVGFLGDTTRELLKFWGVIGTDKDKLDPWIADKVRNQLERYRKFILSLSLSLLTSSLLPSSDHPFL